MTSSEEVDDWRQHLDVMSATRCSRSLVCERVWPRNMLLRHLCYGSKFGHSRSSHTSVFMDICQIILTPPRPFKVTRGRWNRHRSIGHLWLPI